VFVENADAVNSCLDGDNDNVNDRDNNRMQLTLQQETRVAKHPLLISIPI
jgi:hypothetical protein